MAKNGHNAKAIYRPCKILSLGQKIKINCLKHAKNVSTNTLKFFYAKNSSKSVGFYTSWSATFWQLLAFGATFEQLMA